MKALLQFSFYFLPFFMLAQNMGKTEDQQKVEGTVLEWCDSVFITYNDPIFSSYKANFTDEYTMLLLRIESLEKSKSKTIRDYKEGKLAFSEHDFDLKMLDYKKRIEKAAMELRNFKPKVTSYVTMLSITTITNTNKSIDLLYKITLDNDFNILKKERKTSIGSNESIQLKKT